MSQQQLFPDLVVVMEVDVSDVQMRLLPLYLSKWQVQHEEREKQRSILQEQHKKNRVRQSQLDKKTFIGFIIQTILPIRRRPLPKGELNSGKNIKKR